MELTHQWLLEHLNYDPETGVISVKKSWSSHKREEVVLGYKETNGYVRLRIGNKLYSGHRIAFFYVYGRWPICVIDHINRVKHDNRISNLREATFLENTHNALHKGYTFERNTKKYHARIQHGEVKKSLGRFKTEEEAGAAYLKAKKELHPFFEQGAL